MRTYPDPRWPDMVEWALVDGEPCWRWRNFPSQGLWHTRDSHYLSDLIYAPSLTLEVLWAVLGD